MKTVRVVAAIISDGSRILATQRGYGDFAGGWEFPGGKIEPGESPEEALARELREELDIGVDVGRVRDAEFYRYPDRDVLLLFYGCRIASGEPRTLDCNAVAWAAPEELAGYDFAGADLEFVRRNFISKKD